MTFNLIITVCILMSVAMPTLSYSCSNYPANGTWLHFTDPNPSNLLIQTFGNYVSLLCCAANYNDITWYFEDQPYPHWNLSKHLFDNYIGVVQDGQEFVISKVNYDMEGRYKCVIRKDNESLEFTQSLWVKPKQAQLIYARREPECVDKSAKNGDNVTFYCNFFIGESELCPIITWSRNDTGTPYLFGFEQFFGPYSNFTSFEVVNDPCTSGDILTIGTALNIYNVSDDAYGVYYLNLIRDITVPVILHLTRINETIQQPVPQVIIEQSSTLVAIVLGTSVVLLIALTLMFMYFKIDIQLFFRRRNYYNRYDDQKKYDAFISHSNSDEDRKFVISNLRKFLVNDLSYNVCIDGINFLPGEDHSTASVDAVNSSRCCILVLSPDYAKHQYCSLEFSKALEKHSLKKNIIPIMFQNISPDSLNRQEALQHLIKAGEVLKWRSDGNNKSFWKKLEVRMPPRYKPLSSTNNKYIDRSTSTNSQTFLFSARSISKDSAISYSHSDEIFFQTEELFQQEYTVDAV